MKAIQVVEIPPEATTAQIEGLLNGPEHGRYYLHSWYGCFAVFQHRTGVVTQSKAATPGGPDAKANWRTENLKAAEFMRANPTLSSRKLADALLKETGIRRSYKWFVRERNTA